MVGRPIARNAGELNYRQCNFIIVLDSDEQWETCVGCERILPNCVCYYATLCITSDDLQYRPSSYQGQCNISTYLPTIPVPGCITYTRRKPMQMCNNRHLFDHKITVQPTVVAEFNLRNKNICKDAVQRSMGVEADSQSRQELVYVEISCKRN